MSSSTWGTWARGGAALLLLGCGSKLQIDKLPPGGGGDGGTGGFAGSVVITAGTGGVAVGGGSGGTVTGGYGGTELVTAGGGGVGGTITEPIPPGSLGQRCIPGSTVTDATGTFAQADVAVLDHCAGGLDCGSDGLCAPIQDCPRTSGICFVREPDPGANSGGGSGGSFGSTGGTGYSGTGGSQEAGARPESTVSALAADDAHLYWVEYGTRDSLGNYRNDGALMSFAFADGKTKKLAAALPGPIALGVTSTHAYVYVDSAPLIGSPIHSQLLRLPLAGGASELVQDRTTPGTFLGVGDRAFWTTPDGIESVAASTGAIPSAFFTGSAYDLSADATNVYFSDFSAIEAAPLAGGAAQSLGLTPLSFGLNADFLYGIEEINNSTGLILDRAAKSGGTWQRIRALGAGGYSLFQIVGDRYFWSSAPPQVGPYVQPDNNRLDIQTASFTTDDAPVRLVELATQANPSNLKWVGTATALYWTDGNAIYAQGL